MTTLPVEERYLRSAETGRLTPDPRLFGHVDEDRDLRLYRRMRFIRCFEERLLALFEEGALNGTTHACIGQEADSVAIFEHLRDEDHVFSNHRCHGHYLARTGDALGLLAEIMGKSAGVCGGIGGSQHLCGPGFKSNGILGGTVPAATGIALAKKIRHEEGLSVTFIGDGTLGEGVLYESLNIAALWQLPLLVVMENNSWSQSTPLHLNFSGDMPARFTSFGLPVRRIDSTDVLEIDAAARDEIAALRSERRPRVLLIDTYRLCHHSKSDDDRPAEEIAERWTIEPLVIHGRRIAADQRDKVDAEVATAMEEVVATARELE